MKSLLKYLKPYRRDAILAPLFKMLEAAFELFVPLVVAGMIDLGIRQGSTAEVFRRGLLLLLLAAIGLACSVTAQYFSARAAVGTVTDLKSALFRHVLTLSYTDLDRLGTSALITRMTSDMNQVQSGLNLTLRLLLRSPFVVFGAMMMAFYVDMRAAVVFAVVIPVLCIVVFAIMLKGIPMYRQVQERLDKVVGLTRDTLSGVRVIRAFNRQQEEADSYQEETGKLHGLQVLAGRLSALQNPVTYVIINLALVVLIRSGALRVNAGSLTQGELTALVNYMSQILVELIKMASLIISITRALACARRIQSVMDTEPSRQYGSLTRDAALEESNRTDAPLLELKDVCVRYADTSDDALEHVSLTLRRGQTLGVIGGTGSGKSSLVNVIAGHYEASSGEVLLWGQDICTYEKASLGKIVCSVPQQAQLFAGTVEENLRWGNPQADEAAMRSALETAQAAEFVFSRPEGLQSRIEQGGRNLSGGQRQRLCIARTLLREPDILILDDSSSALDYATDAKLRAGIAGLKGGPAVILISQRASSIRGADFIVVLDDGQVIGQGTHDELLQSCPAYREMYEAQFQTGGEAS